MRLWLSDVPATIRHVSYGPRATMLTGAVAVLLASIAAGVASGAGPNGSASAGGIGATLPSGAQASASATSDGQQHASAQGGGISDGAGSVGSASVDLGASSDGPAGTAEASASASGISLLGGRIQVGSLTMTVRATAAPGTSTAGTTASSATGVSVDGSAVSTAPGSRVDVAGAGTLVFFEQVADGNGSVRANALRFEVTSDTTGLPVGTQIVIGHLEASAAPGDLAPAPAPTSPAATAPSTPATPRTSTRPVAPRAAPDPSLARPVPKPLTAETPDGQRGPVTSVPTGSLPPVRALPAPEPIVIPGLLPVPEITLPRQPAPTVSIAPNADGYVFPVFGQSSFSDDYGAPRAITGWHHGNDIFGAAGLPLLAVADGVLSKVGVNAVGGNRLWLTDTHGNAYYYAHLSGYPAGVEDGLSVKAGQVIGFLGNSGQAITTPLHLHFEIHPAGGDSVDPFPYLSAWQQRASLPLAIPEAANSASSIPVAGALVVSFRQTVDTPVGPGDGDARAVG